MPPYLCHDIPGGVKILHLNIGNLKRKMQDIKDDDNVKNSHIISLNETHLGHIDTLTSDMMGISKDVLIVHCDHNKRRWCCPHCKQEPKSKTNQNEYNFGNCCCKDKWTNSDDCCVSLLAPSTPIDVFVNHMLEIITQFQHVPTCIIGDFNEDVSITSNTHCCGMIRLQAFKANGSVNWHMTVEQ